MNIRIRIVVIIMALCTLLAISGCAFFGQLLSPAFTPTPASTPTPTAIAGIQTPITVDGAGLLIVMATNDPALYESGAFAIQTQPGETVLHVEAQTVSGNIDLGTFAQGVYLTDENGNKCPLVSYGNEKPFWEFMVPKTSKSFTLHLPDGQTIKLDSILKMIP